MSPSVSEQVQKNYCNFAVFCNILNQYCHIGDINNRDHYTNEILVRFHDLIPLVDGVIYDDDIKERCYAVNRIMLQNWDYIREIAEKATEEQQKNPADEDAALESVKEQLERQIPNMAEMPVGEEAPVSENKKFQNGRYLDQRKHLMDQEGRFFSKKSLPSEKKSLAVAVLMDESGSMCGQDRVTYARAAGIISYDFCKAMGVPVLIMGHTDDGDVQLYAYTDFDSVDELDRYRLTDMSARHGNRDGAALRYVADRLLKQSEINKLLMIVSDGQPTGHGEYNGSAAEADLRGIKKEYTNKGMMLVAAMIGADKENIERIYGDAYMDITDLTKLPMMLLKRIERELKG